MLQLIVISPFADYVVGEAITDPAVIRSIVAGPDARNVVEVNIGPGSPETITVGVRTALAGEPLILAGEITSGTPATIDCSGDAGISWIPVGSFVLAGDSWTGTGPVFGSGHSGTILVRDHLFPGVISVSATFTVGGSGGGTGLAGTLTLGDGSAIDRIGSGLAAPQGLAAGAGALSVAFGTGAGLVADGGVLAAETVSRVAETASRQAGDTAGSVALAAEVQTRQGVETTAATAQSAEVQARQAGDVTGATALTAEGLARQSGDAGVTGAVTAETSARQSGDTGLASAVMAETSARQSGDAGITGAVTAETSARQSADTGLASAVTAETSARQSGDTAGASALAAVNATATAALPATARGAASGVAPLDGNMLVPVGNLPSPAGAAWADTAGAATIFHRGPVPVPAASRPGLLQADRTKLTGDYDFAEIWDTQANYDAWPALQNFLLYCQLMALAAKTSGIDNIAERNCVRAVLPRGAYLISQPLYVPEFVELDIRGVLYRAAYTGNQANDGVNSVPGIFATNSFLPTVVVVPRAHAKNLNIYVNTDGNIAHRGSGVCIGKTWAAQTGAACTMGNAGTGYGVGDLLFMAQPSVGPYFNWAAQVTAISGGGTTGPVSAATVFAAGAYALPPATYNNGPSLQQQQWTAANGFPNVLDPAHPGCFVVHAAYRADGTTPSAGTGATLAPAWQADYVAGVAAYNIGSAITNGCQIGKIQITGGIPSMIDATHGPTFGVMVTGLETVIDEIQLLGGNAGVYGYFAQDVRIGIINVVEAGVGVELFGCGSWHCQQIVLDTCGAALLINQTQGVRFGFRAFFEQNNIRLSNAYPNSLGNAVVVGSASSATYPCADIHLDGTLVNMGGLPQTTIAANPGIASGNTTPRPMAASLSLAWLFSSVIRVKVTNIGEQGGKPTILPTSSFCQLGLGIDPGNIIEGAIDTVPVIDGVAAPAQMVTLTAGHGFPACALHVWDGMHGCWIGPYGVVDMFGTAVPGSGTGMGFAAAGSSYIDTASGAGRRYVNTGTQAAPVWS